MKKLVALVVVLVAACSGAEAQSMLKVRLKDNTQQITLAVDGRYFNTRGTSVTVGDLPYGSHNLKIYAIVLNRRGRPKEELVYDATVKTYNGMISMLIYDPETGNSNMQDMEINAYSANHSIPPQQPAMANSNDVHPDGNYDTNDDVSSSGASPVPPEQMGTLTDEKMQSIKTKAADKKTDVQKTSLLKDELKNEKITTMQVADLMDLFTFEASKVDFAKWAYSITADQQYYSDLINKLTYKNYQDELDQFIKGK